jgi:hypothetical protein
MIGDAKQTVEEHGWQEQKRSFMPRARPECKAEENHLNGAETPTPNSD